jgi:hypothetical protein
MCEYNTHDLVQFDMKMKELKRIKGTPYTEGDTEATKNMFTNKRVIQPINSSKLLWLKGMSSLAIVELPQFEAKEIPNFWTYSGAKCSSLFVLANADFKRIAGVGITSDQQQTIHVYDIAGGTGFSSASTKKLFASSSVLSSEGAAMH